MESCESCRFWKKDESFAFKEVAGPNIGTCRRFPPTPIYYGRERTGNTLLKRFRYSVLTRSESFGAASINEALKRKPVTNVISPYDFCIIGFRTPRVPQ